jgi:hypothetical protein
MEGSKVDFKYSLDFLDRINKTNIDGYPLAHRQIFNKYNVWHFYQTRILFSDMKRYVNRGKGKNVKPGKNIWNTIYKDIVLFIFSGLLFIVSIARLFINKKVIVYSIDKVNSPVAHNDTRLDFLYRVLVKRKIKFVEIFHAIPGRSVVDNLLQRRRVAIYDYFIDWLFGFISVFKDYPVPNISNEDLFLFRDEEKPFARNLISHYLLLISRSEFRVKVFSFILKWSGTKMVLTIDNTRDYNELVLAARLNNVPVFAFQHGHFTKYHAGWLVSDIFEGVIVRPNRLYVWSKYWKDELLRLNTYFLPEEIIVGGSKEVGVSSLVTQRLDEMIILIPFETDSIKSEVKAYLDALLKGGFKVIFKVRGDQPTADQLKVSELEENYHINLSIISDTKVALGKASVVLGTYSTFLYDAVEALKPVVYMKTKSDFGEGIVTSGLATVAESPKNICNVVRAAYLTSEEVLRARKSMLVDTVGTMEETVDVLLRGV